MTDATPFAYLIAQIEIKDYQDYADRYAIPVIAMLHELGADVLAASHTYTLLEGSWPGNWTVLLRFPSMADAERWYSEAAYKPYKALRINELTRGTNAVFIAGFDPSALGG